MARRRRPEPPPSESLLPFRLRPENGVVEDFVLPEEQPPADWIGEDPPYRCWRRLRAWRRWQTAVEAWGAECGLGVSQLRALGLYPVQPPPFGANLRSCDHTDDG
jgi:hypothetical protein